MHADERSSLFLSAGRWQTGLSIDDQSALYSDLEKELKDIQARQRFMDTGYVEKLEHRMLIDRALNELMGAAPERMPADEAAPLGTVDDVEGGLRGMQEQGGVRITWGVIDVDRLEAFDRLLFRATRGNAIFKASAKSEYFEKPLYF